MSAGHAKETWDFFFTNVDHKPASFFLSMDAMRDAPERARPLMVRVRITMRSPRKDGLRSQEEAEALFALEDRLAAALCDPLSMRFVGRVVTNGFSDFFFYAPSGLSNDAVDRALQPVLGGYKGDVVLKPDADWSIYRTYLYPDARQLQYMANRTLLRQMQESGDDISVARLVDHYALFASEADAMAAATRLGALGFKIAAPPRQEDGDGRWGFEFNREETPEGSRMHDVVDQILDVLEPLKGEYDGWGSVLAKRPEAPKGGFWKKLIGKA